MKRTRYKTYDELPLVLSVMDVSEVLSISRSGAYALFKRCDFPSIAVGNRLIVPKSSFIKWLEQHKEN